MKINYAFKIYVGILNLFIWETVFCFINHKYFSRYMVPEKGERVERIFIDVAAGLV